MSILFCVAVKELLETNAGFAVAVPGGLYPAEISKDADDPREQCVGVYWSGGGSPVDSVSRVTGIEAASMTIRIEAETVAQLETAGAALAAVIGANRRRWASAGGAVVARLRYTRGETRAVPHPDGSDRSVHQVDFTISGFCPVS